MRKYRNQIIIGFGVALAVYIGLLIFLDTESKLSGDVWRELKAFPLWLLLPLALTQVAAGIFRFMEWHYYLGVIDARDKISVFDSAVLFVSSFTMVVSPGKAAELLKAVMLKTKTGVPVAKSAPIVIAERVVDGIAVLIATLIAVLIAGDDLNLGEYRGLVLLSGTLIICGLIVVQIAPLVYFCLNLLRRLPLMNRFHAPLVEFYESSREIFKLRHVLPTTLLGVGVYLASAVAFMLILYGFGLKMTGLLFLQVTFMVGVTSAIGALSFIPNGAGVTEISTVGMLLAIVAPGEPLVTSGVAAAAAILQGFFHKWFRVVVGMAVALIFRDRLFSGDLDAELAQIEAERQQANSYNTEASRA